MNLLRAAYFVLTASALNRVRRQVRRLREPRYLVATALGGLYFWSVFFRRVTSLGKAGHAPEWGLPAFELLACLLGIFGVAMSWLFGDEEGALRFTEPEVQFFFPAPTTRTGLIRYKLARTAVITAFSAVLTTAFVGWRLTSHWGCFLIGQWIALTTLSLHTSAASLARASLADHGLRGFRRQAVTLLVLAAMGGLAADVFMNSAALDPPDLSSLRSMASWCRGVLQSPPTSYLLLVARASLDVVFATGWGAALRALPLALLVLGLHYLWLVRSDVAFEEASVDAAQRVASRMEAFRAGRGLTTVQRVRAPFALGPRGRPEVALFWKNVVGIVRAYSLRGVLIMLYLGIFSLILAWAVFEARTDVRWGVGLLLCLMMASYLALLGPIILRCDFRQDLQHVDLLRAWPMSGRQVVTGEILAPTLVLSLGQWASLGLAAVFSHGVEFPALGTQARLAIIAAAALVLPALTLCTLVLQNGAALLFPGWAGAERRVRGIEAMGQRLLTLAGNLLALLGALVPATALSAGVLAATWWALGWGGVPIAALAGVVVLLGEAYFAVGWLGGVFERFDLTQG